MKKLTIFLIMVSFMMLVACSSNNQSTEGGESSTEEQQAQTDNDSDNTLKNATSDPAEDTSKEEEQTANNDSKSLGTPSDAKGVLAKIAEAMGQVKGMVLTGESQSSTNMGGIVTEETSQISGKMTLNPFTQHQTIESKSNMGSQTMEIYTTQDAIYMKTSDSESWMSMPLGQGGLSGALTESHFKNFSEYYEMFELSEEGGNYILSFSGSGDEYKQIAYGALKEMMGEEKYLNFINNFSEVSGSYRITVAKDSFHIMAFEYESEITMKFGETETKSKDHSVYKYSGFNQVDEIIVPKEVIESTQSMMQGAAGGGE